MHWSGGYNGLCLRHEMAQRRAERVEDPTAVETLLEDWDARFWGDSNKLCFKCMPVGLATELARQRTEMIAHAKWGDGLQGPVCCTKCGARRTILPEPNAEQGPRVDGDITGSSFNRFPR